MTTTAQDIAGRQAHAANVARWPRHFTQPCAITRAAWPYDCDARTAHPAHAVFRCEPHGVWWHEDARAAGRLEAAGERIATPQDVARARGIPA